MIFIVVFLLVLNDMKIRILVFFVTLGEFYVLKKGSRSSFYSSPEQTN